ncbi:MAG: amino acid adenylation domain-containing protein, partial [Cytophagales bacterium]|nr:amino acid adenylation domain-containing protein [Cytophagales bacterium]
RVGIMAGLSEWTLVSILGVLKAGAAFVPIDPDAPDESIYDKLADAAVTVLITDAPPLKAPGCPVLRLSDERDAIAAGFAGELPEPDSQALAYVLYTSGTTGRPKGVAIKHASLCNYISWAHHFYHGSRMGNMPLFTSLAFDLTLTSVFLPITSGSTVSVSPSSDVVESLRWAFAPGNGVHTVKLTPSHILMLPYLDLKHTEVQQIIAGGEKLTQEHIRTVQKLNPSIAVFDEYGPTEATVGCVAVPCTPDTEGIVGQPISNAEIYLLSDAGKLLPLGAKGEIYIGGACLAEGYFGQKEMTDQKFVPSPFRPGECMYRTGDLGRWLPDGNLVFYGRCDEQLKFYGNRIEPEEIEAALKKHEGIRRCVVAKRVNAAGEDMLVAYYVAGAAIETQALQHFLARYLAKSVIPTHFVHIRKLPLTLNGKLNLRALPDPETVAGSAGAYVAPQNETEEKLAQIWREVLGKERIGTQDNFFELGGHSLKATRIVSRVHKEFQVQAPLRSIFNHPTVQALAAYVNGLRQDGAASDHEDLSDAGLSGKNALAANSAPSPDGACYPAYHRQAGEWVMNKLNRIKGLGSYNMQWTTTLETVDREALERTLVRLVSRHESLRTTLHLVDGAIQQKVHADLPGPIIAFTDLRGEADAEKKATLRMELARKQFFDFETGPLFSAQLVQLELCSYFVFTINHAISDAWSLKVLEGELTTLYKACCAGEPDPLPPMPVQAKAYAAWEKAVVTGQTDQKHGDYWQQKLSGTLPLFYLSDYYADPVNAVARNGSYRDTLLAEIRETMGQAPLAEYPDLFGLLHRVKTYQGALYKTVIRAELFEKLAALTAQTRTTLFNGILASFNLFLYQLTGKADVVTGIQVLTRDDEQFKNLLGWCINTVFLRQQVDEDLTFGEFVGRTGANLAEAFEHKAYPMERVLADLDVSLDAIGSVNMNYMSFDTDEAELQDFSQGHKAGNYFPYFDVDCYFFQYKNGIEVQCIYKSGQFKEETIEMFFNRYLELLQRVAGSPEQKISALLEEQAIAQPV